MLSFWRRDSGESFVPCADTEDSLELTYQEGVTRSPPSKEPGTSPAVKALLFALFLLVPAAIGYGTALFTTLQLNKSNQETLPSPKEQVKGVVSTLQHQNTAKADQCSSLLPVNVYVEPSRATWMTEHLGDVLMSNGQKLYLTDGATSKYNLKVVQGVGYDCMSLQNIGSLLYVKNPTTGQDVFYDASKLGITCQIAQGNIGLSSIADIECSISKAKTAWTLYSTRDFHDCEKGKKFTLTVGNGNGNGNNNRNANDGVFLQPGSYAYLLPSLRNEWQIGDYTDFSTYSMYNGQLFSNNNNNNNNNNGVLSKPNRPMQQGDFITFQWSQQPQYVAMARIKEGFQQIYDPGYFRDCIPVIWQACTYATYSRPVRQNCNGRFIDVYWQFIDAGFQHNEREDRFTLPLMHTGTYYFAAMTNIEDPASPTVPKAKIEYCSLGQKVAVTVSKHPTLNLNFPEDDDGPDSPTEDPFAPTTTTEDPFDLFRRG